MNALLAVTLILVVLQCAAIAVVDLTWWLLSRGWQ